MKPISSNKTTLPDNGTPNEPMGVIFFQSISVAVMVLGCRYRQTDRYRQTHTDTYRYTHTYTNIHIHKYTHREIYTDTRRHTHIHRHT